MYPEYGGPAKLVPELARAQSELGHDVWIYTTDAAHSGRLEVPTEIPLMISGGVKLCYFPVSWRTWMYAPLMNRAIEEKVKEFDIVHVHGLYFFDAVAIYRQAVRGHIPFVIAPHGALAPVLRRKGWLKKWFYHRLFTRRQLEKAEFIHFTTKEERELVNSSWNLQTESAILANGLFLSEYDVASVNRSFRSTWAIDESDFLFLFLGRIHVKKGLDLLAKAFGSIARRGYRVHLAIVGPNHSKHDALQVRQWLEDEQVSDRITFTGMLTGEDKLAAFKGSDFFVLPSYSENFGIAVAEAMACNVPVIVSDKVPISREIADAGAGHVVSCDVEALTSAMLCALKTDKNQRTQMGQNGRQLVADKYSWQQIGRDSIKLYAKALTRQIVIES